MLMKKIITVDFFADSKKWSRRMPRIKEISFPIPLDPPVTIAVFVEKLSIKQFYKFSVLL